MSSKNITSADPKAGLRPSYSFDTMRISFTPVEGQKTKKALVIYPNRGLEGMIILTLERVNHETNFGSIKNKYYDALENKEKRTVVVTTNGRVLTAISIVAKLNGVTYTMYYTDIMPVLRDD